MRVDCEHGSRFCVCSEITQVFPDRYVHLGGDEVEFECWRSNANLNAFMRSNNITTYEKLVEVYVQRVVNIAEQLNVGTVVWEEVFTNGVRLNANSTVVHIWRPHMRRMLADVTAAGLSAIASSCWYLDHLATGGDWQKFYECDPHDFVGSDAQKDLVLGGETCMWSEVVNHLNVVQRVFPRACAAAEKLWSPAAATLKWQDAAARLEEHTCRMNLRGVAAQPPNAAGYCF